MKQPAVWLTFFLLSCLISNAQNKGITKSTEPKWITHNIIDYSVRQLDKEAQDGMIYLQYETQSNLADQSVFYKYSERLISESGVQNNSEISVNYNPEYQQLIFHSIRIIRGNQIIDQLNLSKIKTVHQEKDLRRFLYNGTVTAVLILNDVRKGDVIEYSYTLKGWNPIFNNKYSAIYDLQYSVPIYNLYYKLITPAGRSITIGNHNSGVSPFISNNGDNKIYEWKLTNVKGMSLEADVPSWYDPYPVVLVSEFSNWKDVNDWAYNLFPVNIEVSTDLANKISAIKETNRTDADRVAAALRFVQDDIRYMGVEMGVNSHMPHNPNQVFNQRYGDCKDKSYLLSIILRKMNIEANPVLINTDLKKTLFSYLPSPTLFDHVTVQVKLNGSVYYFDPTINFQRGPIDQIYYPDYQAGLVISDQTNNLTTIAYKDLSNQHITEEFSVPDMSGSAKLKVTTVFKGYFADESRGDFKSSSVSEIQKNYIKAYKGYFDTMKADSLTYSDDETTGQFTTTEYYTIDDLWGSNSNFKKVSFEPFVIGSFLNKPKDLHHMMPYTINYPVDYYEDIEVDLPESWKPDSYNKKVSNQNFKYTLQSTCLGAHLSMKYSYKTLKDFVSPDENARYISDIDKANSDVAYHLSKSNVDASPPTSNPFGGNYASLYLILGLCVGITVMIRKGRR